MKPAFLIRTVGTVLMVTGPNNLRTDFKDRQLSGGQNSVETFPM